jgi:hypothetical protein
MKNSKLDRILNNIRMKINEDMTATGGGLAGLPPEEPPVDLRKHTKSHRIWLNVLHRNPTKSNGKRNS